VDIVAGYVSSPFEAFKLSATVSYPKCVVFSASFLCCSGVCSDLLVEAKDLLQLLHIHAAVGCWATRKRFEAREICEDMLAVQCDVVDNVDVNRLPQPHMKPWMIEGRNFLASRLPR